MKNLRISSKRLHNEHNQSIELEQISNVNTKSRNQNSLSQEGRHSVVFSIKRCLSLSRSAWNVIAFIIFTLITLSIGVIIVCFTAPKPPNKDCQHTFKAITKNQNTYTSRPISITTGYLDHDHILDIAVTNSATDNIAILLGYDNGTFTQRILYPTGTNSYPNSIAIGDFNRDKRLDIVVTNFGTHSIGLFLGYGNGSFADQIVFSTGSFRPFFIEVADLNTDSCPDIVVTNQGTNDISIFLGNCNGSFQVPMIYSTGYDSVPYEVTVADFNQDNYFDIAVTNSGTNDVAVFLGYGNGSFKNPKMYSTGPSSYPHGLAHGDFNRDSQLDLVVANYGSNEIILMLGYGNGSFQSRQSISYNPDARPEALLVEDFNNDNKLDIAVVNTNKGTVGILLGHGNGDFAEQIEYSTGSASQPLSLAIGHFNLDNYVDIAITNYGLNTVGILFTSTIIFGGNETISIENGSFPSSITNGDFNNDTHLDIVVANRNTNNINIFLGNGIGRFTLFATYSTGIDSKPLYIVTADINHDDVLDIIVANSGKDNIGVTLGYGNGTFTNFTLFSTDPRSTPVFIAIDDFNNDSHFDITVANSGTNNIGIMLGFGDGTFSNQTIYAMGDGSKPVSITVGDFNNDNRLDIVVTLFQVYTISVLLGYGDGTFQLSGMYPTEYGTSPGAIVSVDFNNDNKLDIAVVTWGTFGIRVSFGDGNGHLTIPMTYSTGLNSYPNDIKVCDVNNDNVSDLVVANSASNNIGIFRGYSNGTFSSQSTISIGSSHPVAITVGDFNHDGWFDLVIANDISSNIAILLGNYRVIYEDMITYVTGSGSHPYFVTVGDFNNDDILDLVLANNVADNIDVLQGFGNGSFENQRTYLTGLGSGPFSIVVADVNNDNQSDIIVANRNSFSIGLFLGYGNGTFASMKTYSTDRVGSPMSIAANDLNNDGRFDIIVAQYTANSIAIFFGYNYTSFRTTGMYSTGYLSRPLSITIGDFNNDNHSDIAVTNTLTNYIGILLGYGNGFFSDQVIYFTGSNTAPYSIDRGDFNNDSWLDIAVTNQDANSVGILLGYGDGTFGNITTMFTGNGSRPQYLTVNDFNNDGQLDIAVTNLGTNSIGLFFGNVNGTFTSQKILSIGPNAIPSNMIAADLNNDGSMDIAVAILNNSTIGILLGHGNGTFQEVRTYAMGIETTIFISIAFGDLNNDKQPDIVAADYQTNQIGIFLGHGDGTFAICYTYATGSDSLPSSVAVGDLNNDNQLDICVFNAGIQKLGIFYGYGQGDFTAMVTYDIADSMYAYNFALSDLNHDEELDIVIADFGLNYVRVLVANGREPFSNSISFSTGSNSVPYDIAIGDLNNDSYKDIAVANFGTNNIGILFGRGNRSFSNILTQDTMENDIQPISIVIGQLNRDHCLDIAVANLGTDNVRIFLGRCDGTFQKQISYPTGYFSLPVSLVLSDFNNDNLIDISIANVGSNNIDIFFGYGDGTFEKQTSYPLGYDSRPICISVGDFNRDGWIDMAVTNYYIDELVIFLNSC